MQALFGICTKQFGGMANFSRTLSICPLQNSLIPVGFKLNDQVKRNFGVFSSQLNFSMNQNMQLLKPILPSMTQSCGYKIKGLPKRRCKSCFFVMRDSRLYVECKAKPRHKQMQMAEAPHNTWILTHATQSKVRPW